jgi:nucleotide-binding universal stress UspA family protein
MFRSVLVGVDGSPSAREALQEAIGLVMGSRGRLGLICAVPPLSPLTFASPFVPAVCGDTLEDQAVQWAQNVIRAAVADVPDDVPVTTQIVRAKPACALQEAAARGCWDLVVVGHRGLGARLLRHCSVPVLVVRSPAERAQRNPTTTREWLRSPSTLPPPATTESASR